MAYRRECGRAHRQRRRLLQVQVQAAMLQGQAQAAQAPMLQGQAMAVQAAMLQGQALGDGAVGEGGAGG